MTLSIQNNLSKRNENKSYDGDSPKLILSATFFFICSKAFAPFTVASHCLRTLQRLRCRFGESIVFRFCLSATDFVCVPCIAPTVSHYYSTETKNRNVTFTGRRRIEFFFLQNEYYYYYWIPESDFALPIITTEIYSNRNRHICDFSFKINWTFVLLQEHEHFRRYFHTVFLFTRTWM